MSARARFFSNGTGSTASTFFLAVAVANVVSWLSGQADTQNARTSASVGLNGRALSHASGRVDATVAEAPAAEEVVDIWMCLVLFHHETDVSSYQCI